MKKTTPVVDSADLRKKKRNRYITGTVFVIISVIGGYILITNGKKIDEQNMIVLFGTAISTVLSFCSFWFPFDTFEIPKHTLVFAENGTVLLDTKDAIYAFKPDEKNKFLCGEYKSKGPITWTYSEVRKYGQSGYMTATFNLDNKLEQKSINVSITNPLSKEVARAIGADGPLLEEMCSDYSYSSESLLSYWMTKKLILFRQQNIPNLMLLAVDEEKYSPMISTKITEFITQEFKTLKLEVEFSPEIEVEIN